MHHGKGQQRLVHQHRRHRRRAKPLPLLGQRRGDPRKRPPGGRPCQRNHRRAHPGGTGAGQPLQQRNRPRRRGGGFGTPAHRRAPPDLARCRHARLAPRGVALGRSTTATAARSAHTGQRLAWARRSLSPGPRGRQGPRCRQCFQGARHPDITRFEDVRFTIAFPDVHDSFLLPGAFSNSLVSATRLHSCAGLQSCYCPCLGPAAPSSDARWRLARNSKDLMLAVLRPSVVAISACDDPWA